MKSGKPAGMSKTIYEIEQKTIDGKAVSLAEYKGKVMLIVNVASECGFTRQYAGLEELNKTYREKGLRVMGFPANEFGAQEPGTDASIQSFCTTKFGASFDMFAKVKVKGDGTDPLFAFLQSRDTNPTCGEAVKWNFHKFLVGKDGQVLGSFSSNVEPTSAELTAAIEKALL